MGREDPNTRLDQIFPYVGDKATPIQTRTGPAPPVVTGTFGPLDIVESILGEIDDKTATGSLSSLAVRLPSGGSSNVRSAVETLISALEVGEFLRVIPSNLVQQLKSLKFSTAATGKQEATWKEVNQNPSGIWDAIEPFFSVRDSIVRAIREAGPNFRFVVKPIAEISAKIDEMLFAALAAILGPV